MRVAAGDTITASSGSAAPTVNEAAEAPAAWKGRACDSSVMPSSSRACADSTSPALSSSATWSASAAESPRLR